MNEVQDYEVINNHTYLRFSEDEVQIRLDLYHKIARSVWAIIILLVQLNLGIKPKWSKK